MESGNTNAEQLLEEIIYSIIDIPDLVINERSYFNGTLDLTLDVTYVAGCTAFQDGSLRLFVVRKEVNSSYLSQKIIYANGSESDMTLDHWGLPMGIQPNTLSTIAQTNVLFAYANGTSLNYDPTNPIQKDTWAGIADENGNLLHHVLLMENNEFSEINIDNMFGINNTAHQLVANEWKVYNNATLIGSNQYNNTGQGCVVSYNPEATMDGGFLIVWSVTIFPTNISDPTSPQYNQSLVYAAFLLPNSADVKTSPFVIFSGTTAYETKILACAGSDIGDGFNCFLQLFMNATTDEVQPYQVNFLSSGMVHDVIPLRSNITNDKATFGDLLDVAAIPLQYGGFLLLHSSLRENIFTFTDFFATQSILDLFTTDGKLVKEQTTQVVYTGGSTIFPNNTVILLGMPSNWLDPRYSYSSGYAIYYIDIPKFYYDDNGYQNLNVLSSYPSIGASDIPITSDSTTFTISLTFRDYVFLSGRGDIKIYQSGYEEIPRLTIPNTLITTIHNDNSTTFTADLISSTLNLPNTEYYIEVSNGMVINSDLFEPLPGIKAGVWNFTTASQKVIHSDDVTVLVRFEPQAQQYFISDSIDALEMLNTEISNFLPIEINRISTPYSTWYYDKGKNNDYILVYLKIESGNPSSTKLASDLDNLISYLSYTNMINGSLTSLLDSKYGAIVQTNFWIENIVALILTGVVIVVMGLLYIVAEIKDNKAKNIAVLQFALILIDFSLDLIFLLTHSQDVSFLFIPSLIFFVVPFGFNLFLSSYIVMRETFQNDEFLHWFKMNTATTSVFTVLGSTEVEVLIILSSRIGGIKTLQAPWSERANKKIFLGSLVGFFIEDIPQFIIQILYRMNTANYGYIPFLTFVTSSLVILHSIINKVYLAIARWRDSKRQYEFPSRDSMSDESWYKLMSEIENFSKESKKSIDTFELASMKKDKIIRGPSVLLKGRKNMIKESEEERAASEEKEESNEEMTSEEKKESEEDNENRERNVSLEKASEEKEENNEEMTNEESEDNENEEK
ncbi:2127_t:CDS:10 [Diversispora eburnea]|uniref:2127_t:CDS:1 n=1 Tax=Diversispora eburnea TaxID=1213867 RepID=A0A9N9FUD1_9GLOM|nr:2127_t:CDS:10 [Diversispora eburnea]